MSANTDRLVAIMARLRDPDGGCPWDVEQTFESIVPHTIEEAYEVADAIERGDMAALVDELGDLFLQVVFHARMAQEAGHFDLEDVAGAICDKLVRRHPHVFGDATVDGAEAQTRAWEAQKAAERQAQAKETRAKEVQAKEAQAADKSAEKGDDSEPDGALDGVTLALPALSRALKLQKRAARVGFDWRRAADVLAKFTEESDEMAEEMASGGSKERLADEIGDLLFTCVNLARKLDLEPETALRHANTKFERRFRRLEALLTQQGRRPEDADLAEMEALWQQVKGEE